ATDAAAVSSSGARTTTRTRSAREWPNIGPRPRRYCRSTKRALWFRVSTAWHRSATSLRLLRVFSPRIEPSARLGHSFIRRWSMQRQLTAVLTLALMSTPAAAELVLPSEMGFTSHHEVLVRATPAQAWAALVRPADWWNGEHSYSGDAANMSIAP